MNTIVATYETRRGYELHSQLVLADAARTRADVFVTIWLDPLFALVSPRACFEPVAWEHTSPVNHCLAVD